MVVAHQRQHAAMTRCAGEISMAENVAGAVDARTLAVPEAEHAVEPALAAQLRLLRAPERGRGQIFIDAGLEFDVGGRKMARGAQELLVKSAQRRTTIAGDISRGIE